MLRHMKLRSRKLECEGAECEHLIDITIQQGFELGSYIDSSVDMGV